MEASTKRSPKANEPHNMVNRQVKDKKTRNDKSVNCPINIRKSILEKRCVTTQIAGLEDPLDDIRNLFESERGHQSSAGIKKDECKAPDDNRVSTRTNLFHYYQNEINLNKDRINNIDKSKTFTYYQKPVEIVCHNEIKNKKVETHHQNTVQNYGLYRFGPCYKNDDKRKISVNSCARDEPNENKIKSEKLTKGREVLAADLPKRRDSIWRGEKKYEENLDDMCRSWLLRVKNHMDLKAMKHIKGAPSNCAMDRNFNKNPKPKSSGKDDRKISEVRKTIDKIKKPDTKRWISKNKVVKPTRHEKGKEKFIPRKVQSDHVIYKFRIPCVDNGEVMFLVERLLIHNNLGDRGKRPAIRKSSCCNPANKSIQEENSSDSTELMLQTGEDDVRNFCLCR
ncbi:hypothetical protein C2G38_2160357 [Gigaspora rosea]|uniref:Uncharacterized protein n=1 Tax=Gigaspora rosea TaxID=44941 RepID=A0A397TT44_9GLOM|nr:hypothetical protein C2G38_2232329 [Gigaspora rosea]RIB27511.1 hypothetical protein C2G38_2160357 [Gigaspora rosea]